MATLEQQIERYEIIKKRLFTLGLVLSIAFSIILVTFLILGIIKSFELAELLKRLGYTSQDVLPQEAHTPLMLSILFFTLFGVSFLPVIGGIALIVISFAVFGNKIRRRQILLDNSSNR